MFLTAITNTATELYEGQEVQFEGKTYKVTYHGPSLDHKGRRLVAAGSRMVVKIEGHGHKYTVDRSDVSYR